MAAKKAPGSQKRRRNTPNGARANYCTSEECRWAAWRLYAEGTFAFNAIARGVNQTHHADNPKCPDGPHDSKWAERAVEDCGRAVYEALEHDGPVQLAKLLQGLQSDQQAQLHFATQAVTSIKVRDENGVDHIEDVPDYGLRSLARTRVTDIRLRMAAALGVVTERKGIEVTGRDGAPVQHQFVVEQFGDDDFGGGNRETMDTGDGTSDGTSDAATTESD